MYNTNLILSAAKNGAADFSKIKTMIEELNIIIKEFDPEHKVDNEILGDLRYYLKAKFVLGDNINISPPKTIIVYLYTSILYTYFFVNNFFFLFYKNFKIFCKYK